MILFLILVLVIAVHQILYWVYWWQVKEYRLDRFKAGFSWEMVIWQFDVRKWFRPKATSRALVIVLVSAALCVLAWPVTIFMAPVLVAIAVVISTPPFVFYKRYLIAEAKEKMKNFKGTVIGITGSYGKSSTKEMLVQVLGSRFQVLGTQKNDNSEIGVAQTVLNKLIGDEEFFVVEMGAYKQGEIKAICDIVQPKIGIITGIGDQHLELFGSLENIRTAKFELVESLPKDGLRLVAEEDFSVSDATHTKVFKDHAEFDFKGRHFNVPVLGKALVRNILAVILVANHVGLNLPEIAQALKKFPSEDIYPKLVAGKIIDNSYNNSLESFLAALEYLHVWEGNRKVVVTPGILELGENAKKDHKIIEKELAQIDKVFVTKKGLFKNAELVTNFDKLKKILTSLDDGKTVFLFQGRIPKYVQPI